MATRVQFWCTPLLLEAPLQGRNQNFSFGGVHGRNWEKNLEGVEIHGEGAALSRVSPSPVEWGLGRGLCPLPRNFFRFLPENGAFWCISAQQKDDNVSLRNLLWHTESRTSQLIKYALLT